MHHRESPAPAVGPKVILPTTVTLTPPPPVARTRLSTRGTWSLVDQVLSSATNVGVGLAAARFLGPREFGAFSVALLTYALVLGLSSALSSDPLVIRRSEADVRRARGVESEACATAFSFGAVAGALVLSIGLLVDGPAGRALVVLAPLLPALLLQDALRYVFFARSDARSAAVNDAVWGLSALFGVLAVQLGWLNRSMSTLLAVWALSATLAAGVGLAQAGRIPRFSSVPGWVRTNRRTSATFAADFFLMAGAGQIGLYAVGFTAGLDALGALRAALLLLGPLSMLTAGTRIFILPEGARVRDTAYERLPRAACLCTAMLVFCAGLWGGVVLLLPDGVGRGLLGPSWDAARPLLPAIVAVVAGRAAAATPFLGLRLLDSSRRLVQARAFDAPLTVGLMILGAGLAGAHGAAMGWAAANVLAAGMWWRQFLAAHRDGLQPGVDSPSSSVDGKRS